MASDTGGVPSFSIQGRLYRERERLSFGGMTEQERLLRKQWIADQVLSECEPVEVPELIKAHTNIFKRIYRKPLDVLVYDNLKKRMNPSTALIVRKIVGTSLMLIGCVYATAYHFKYNTNDWTRKGGFRVLTSRRSYLPGETFYTKVKYDPSQEESSDLTETSDMAICEPPTKTAPDEKEPLAGETNSKELCNEKQHETIQEESSLLDPAVDNKTDNTGNDKTDTNVYTSCAPVEPVEVEKPIKPSKTKDKGSRYRSLGSYYANRNFENSPI